MHIAAPCPPRDSRQLGSAWWARRSCLSLRMAGALCPRLCPPYKLHIASGASPDAGELIVREMELVACRHVEGLVPGIHVSYDAIHPILLRRVRIGHQHLAHGVLPPLHPVALRVSQKE